MIDLEEGNSIAYRTKTLIHSIIEGDLSDTDYTYVSDVRECGINLLKHQIMNVIKDYKFFLEKEKDILFLSVRCPSKLPERVSLYDTVNQVLSKYPWFDPSKLCLEFDESIFKVDSEKAIYALKDMKLLKVKTAIIGCGKESFLLSKMTDITPDYVYLDPSVTSYAGSRDKPQLVKTLVDYIRSMYIEVIADGEEQFIKPLRNTECIGFYKSNTLPITLETALNEEDED